MQTEKKVVIFVISFFLVGVVWMHYSLKSTHTNNRLFRTHSWCEGETLAEGPTFHRFAERNIRSQSFTKISTEKGMDEVPVSQSTNEEKVYKANELVVTSESPSPKEQELEDEKAVQGQDLTSDFQVETRMFEGDENLSSMDFQLVFPSELQSAYLAVCSPCLAEFCSNCTKFDLYLDELKAKQSEEEDEAKLFVIPLDPLAWMSTVGKTMEQSKKLAATFIRNLRASRPYIRFKGSDHVFLCSTKSCNKLVSELVVDLSDSKGTRVIFAGEDAFGYRRQWPCPLRMIQVPSDQLLTANDVIGTVIQKASYMVLKGNRWVCSNEKFPQNHWYELDKSQNVRGTFMLEYGFVMCSLPKVGSSMMGMLMRRAMHYEDWKRMGGGINHFPRLSGLLKTGSKKNFTLAKMTFDNPSFVKAVVARNPAARLLSAFLEKIILYKDYHHINGLTEFVKNKGEPPSFDEFLDTLVKNHPDPNKVNQHYRLQSSFCGLRSGAFDFVGDLDTMANSFKEFAQSVDIWENFGADGWGENNDKPFVDASAYNYEPHHSEKKLWQYYTEDLLTKVHNYYKEDFDLFGFSIEPILAVKPSNLSVPSN